MSTSVDGLGTPSRPSPVTKQFMDKVGSISRSWIGDALVGAVLAGLPFLYFWRFITPNLADRATFARGDFLGQYYPLRLFVAEQLGLGRLPLWDPYLYGGQPALGDIQSGAAYPPNLIASWILGGQHFTVTSLEVQVILHFSLAALFTFLFVRRLTGSRFAAVVASLAYTYSGYMTSFPVRQLTMLGVGVWLPLILLFLDMGLSRLIASSDTRQAHGLRSWLGPMIGAGIVFGISILGGHPQTSLYVAYACVAYALFRLWPLLSRRSPPTRHSWLQRVSAAARLLLPVALVLLIGVGLAAVQLLPTMEFIRLSTRAELNYAAVSWGLPIYELVSLLYPGYQGNSPQYLGILTMILAGAGLFLARQRKDRVFWGGLGLVTLLLSLGGNTFLYSFFYNLMPGFGQVRDQERVVFLFAFSMAVLAGYGAQVVTGSSHDKRSEDPQLASLNQGLNLLRRGVARLSVALLILTALFLYGWTLGKQAGAGDIFIGTLRHHVFSLLLLGGVIVWLAVRPANNIHRLLWQAAAIGLIVLNLFTITWEFHIHALPQEGYFPETSTVAFLREQARLQPEPFRISSAGLLPGGSSAGAVYGLRDITGNSPLHLAGFEEFGAQMGEWRRWQLLNVRYVLDTRALDGPGLRRVHEEGDLKTYEVTDPFPQAWIVHDVRAVDQDGEAIKQLNTDGFDLRRAAVVDRDAGLPFQASEGARVTSLESQPNRIAFQAELPTAGLLVLSEVYYPGWEAKVDGQPVPLLRTDVILRGVTLPAGSHRVELTYAPSSLKWGAVISSLTVLGCIVGLAWVARKDR